LLEISSIAYVIILRVLCGLFTKLSCFSNYCKVFKNVTFVFYNHFFFDVGLKLTGVYMV